MKNKYTETLSNKSHTRSFDSKPYTYFRIQRILKNMGWEAEKIDQGYKANRHRCYHEKYRIIRVSDGKVIIKSIHLDTLRVALCINGYPLIDSQSICQTKKSK